MNEASRRPPNRLLGLLRWLLETFGSVIAFMVVQARYGLVRAVIAGAAVGLVAVAIEIARERRVSTLTAFVAASVVIFGALDLRFQSARFIALEPAVGNLLTAGLFFGSIVTGKPIVIEIAERGRGAPLDRPEVRRYLRGVTAAWGLFFVLRAATYVWMAFQVSLQTSTLVRGTLMPLSFGAMFGLEMLARYLRFGRRAFGRGAAAATNSPPDSLPPGRSGAARESSGA
jgi:intracellular septation protein